MKNKTILLTLAFIGILFFQVKAQTTTCQGFNIAINASYPSFYLINGVYEIRACPGDSIYMHAYGIYPNNDISYHQSDSIVTFNWNNLIGATYNSDNSFIINNASPQIQNFTLTAIDSNNCPSADTIHLKLIISPRPSFVGTSQLTDTLCLGDSTSLVANITPGELINNNNSNNNTTYLPDGSGAIYTSNIIVSGAPVQTLNNANQIEFWAILEHSYLGDLNIALSCPNGQSIVLKSYPGGTNTFLGEPLDNNANPIPGLGYEYHWSNQGSTNMLNAVGTYIYSYTDLLGNTQTNNNYLPPSTSYPLNSTATGSLPIIQYLPDSNISNLYGCPLNGTWTLSITDNLMIDNGYIFGWGININNLLNSYFQQNIISQSWNSSSNIISNYGDSITVLPLDTGIFQYTYTATDSFNCVFDTSLYLYSMPIPQISLGNDTTLCAGQSINLSSGPDAAIQVWSTNSSLPIITVDSTGIGLNSKEISVQVIGFNGCINKDTIVISFDNCTSVNNINNEANILIYPNPSNGIFSISGILNNDKNIQMQIFDSSAKLILQRNIMSKKGDFNRIIDLSKFPKGIYYLRLSNKELDKTMKIIIK